MASQLYVGKPQFCPLGSKRSGGLPVLLSMRNRCGCQDNAHTQHDARAATSSTDARDRTARAAAHGRRNVSVQHSAAQCLSMGSSAAAAAAAAST
jgi:phosphoribosyl 1,2-cyclic phosphodiesterase